MHPAYSVIFFTTASGAGYGLLALLAVFGAAGVLAPHTGFGVVAIGCAMALIGAGLAASTFHLGRPERALNAFSQWRSSWLAREGVAAVVAFAPALVFAAGWICLNDVSGVFAWAAAATAFMTLATVYCTGMIYASLRPIRQWHNALTMPTYVTLGLMTGALLLAPLSAAFGLYRPTFAILALVLVVAGWLMKRAYWRHIDATPSASSLGTATGLSAFGAVRMLEAPHTEENFIMREMGFQVARKHARKLRLLATLCLFVAPFVLMALILALGAAAALPFGVLAVVLAAVGVATERWLFFAEATHLSMIYYGRAV
ncbi:MAG: dimethyl sulfoxide reductase anchor subunit [Hyphomicrobiales bacterium]|nr:dimethyl sulfoxide reductase anchor subunit [Hyphomicrobiales bacterium]